MGWIPSGGSGTSLTVAESDGTPSVSGVSTILVSNTTLTDNTGGSVTIAMTPAGGANTALSNLAAVAINAAVSPGADNTIVHGTTALRFSNFISGGAFSIYKAASEANPTATLGNGVLNFGAGTTNAVDVGLKRSSGGVLYVTDGSSGAGDLNAHGLVIADTTMVTNLNADTVDGSHGSAFATVALDNLASVAINVPLVTGVGTALTLEPGARTSDAAPSVALLKGGDSFPGATGGTNTVGANTILAGGIGQRIFTVVDYTQLAGTTVTITVNGTATIKTENVDWYDTTSNGAVAISLASAIDAIAGVTASAATNDVRIVPDAGTYSLTIAKTAADAGMTATSGADGGVVLNNDGSGTVLSIVNSGNTGTAFNISRSGANPVFTIATYGDVGVEGGIYNSPSWKWFIGGAVYGTFGMEAVGTIKWGSNRVIDAADLGMARSAAGLLKVTNGSTGDGNVIASTAITAVGTAAANGYIRTGVYKRAWTNAEVTAFGAVLSGDLKVATLPAKTVIRNAYVVIDSQAAGTTTLTAAMGRTSAAYIDYIVASNAKVAANTVYGDAVAERGTNLTGYDLASYTATTDVYVQFVSTVENLSAVTSCTGTIYLLTEVLP